MIFSQKINEIPEFYMIFARKMPEFYMIIATNCCPEFWGHVPTAPSPTPVAVYV